MFTTATKVNLCYNVAAFKSESSGQIRETFFKLLNSKGYSKSKIFILFYFLKNKRNACP